MQLMKLSLSLRQFIGLIVSIFLVAYIISVSTTVLIDLSKNHSDWVGILITALGNMSGGVIGGVVAYIVASYEAKKSIVVEKRKALASTSTMLKLIREEFRDNILALQSVTSVDSTNVDLFKNQLRDDVWKSCFLYLSVSDSLLVELNVSYRRIQLIRSLKLAQMTNSVIVELKNVLEAVLGKVDAGISDIENALGDSTLTLP